MVNMRNQYSLGPAVQVEGFPREYLLCAAMVVLIRDNVQRGGRASLEMVFDQAFHSLCQ